MTKSISLRPYPWTRVFGISLSSALFMAGIAACSDEDPSGSGDRTAAATDVDAEPAGDDQAEHPLNGADLDALTVTDVVPIIGTGEPDELPEMIDRDPIFADSVRFIGQNDMGAFWVGTTNLESEEEYRDICLISGIRSEESEELSIFVTTCHSLENVYTDGLWGKLGGAGARGIVAYLLPPDVDGANIRDQTGEPVSSIEMLERDGTQVVVRRLSSQQGPDEIISVPRGEGELVLPQM